MKNDLDVRILEKCYVARGVDDGQRGEDGALLAGRELKQIDSIDEPVEARTFGIQRENRRVRDGGEECVDRAGRVEVDGRVRTGHAPNLTASHFTRSRSA